MRHLRLLSAAMFATCALTAFVATSVASAGEEGFLPTTTYTGTGGGVEFMTLAKEKFGCTGTSVLSGTMTNDQQGKIGSLHFTGCKFGSFPMNSLADEKEVILVVEPSVTLCLINSAALEYGVLITLKEAIHVEVPLFGTLPTFSGSFIGKLSPNTLGKEKTITFQQNSGDATVTKCTGAKAKEELKGELKYEQNENKKPENVGLAGTIKLTFAAATELMDS